MNPGVDKYLVDGCMRCKYGATPQCKVLKWVEPLELLRRIVLETGLTEEIKWGVPVYTLHGKNVATINALNGSANIGFFKGVLLQDEHRILQQQGNVQSDRIIRFSDSTSIEKVRGVLTDYLLEAIEIERSGRKIEFKKNPEPIPNELREALEQDPLFKNAFYSLTLGRQRGYIIHFSQPKQSQTRMARIAKYREHILNGIGLHDRYTG
jgi:uncharacterized protein YdeI (YjbR/CyaY-like superfamily)